MEEGEVGVGLHKSTNDVVRSPPARQGDMKA